ncbi:MULTISPECIES: PilN domain-containing protein [unclassified Synechococcus]|uniref:PilN domain-containing protein n=1 Tax=unclassified Synechococcus TaxID=2626047 RepID=UPI000B97DCC3|nr:MULTISPECIES: PilN domain-containing protein [unclassified Synechococcus]MBD2718357.1 PilN domain-containing protein [Synechococcus sp. FACHB-909]
MSPPILDLLRERRKELGQESMVSALQDRRPLLLRGALIGAIVLGGSVLATALVFLRFQYVRMQTAQLTRFEAESTQMQAEMAASRAKLEQLAATNRNLTEGLTTLRTSSALLADLQLRTPEGIQIQSAEAEGTNLVLKGQALDPLAFARINALQLELSRSPLLNPKGVALVKLERVPPSEAPTGQAGTAAPTPTPTPATVRFELSGPFATLPPARQLSVMRQLGSEGMVRRLQLLQAEGLIP